MQDTAGFSMIAQLSEQFINTVVKELFVRNILPSRFRHTDGSGAYLSTRQSIAGREAFVRYLTDAKMGYDLRLVEPSVTLIAGNGNLAILSFRVLLSLPREFYVRSYSDDHACPTDSDMVDPALDYTIVHETVPGNAVYEPPPVVALIRIQLPLRAVAQKEGCRLVVVAGEARRDLVLSVECESADWSKEFSAFLSIALSQFVTAVLRKEIAEVDVGPTIGDLSVFDLGLHDAFPVELTAVDRSGRRALVAGLATRTQVGGGMIENIPEDCGGVEMAIAVNEGVFRQCVNRILVQGFIRTTPQEEPARFTVAKSVVHFDDGGIHLDAVVEGLVIPFRVRARLELMAAAPGQVHVHLTQVQIWPTTGVTDQAFGIFPTVIIDDLLSTFLGAVLGDLSERRAQQALNDVLSAGRTALLLQSRVGQTAAQVQTFVQTIEIRPTILTMRFHAELR